MTVCSTIVRTAGLVAGFGVLGWAVAIPGKTSAKPVSYAKTVAPLFKAHCIDCHGPEDASGKLRLDTPAAILKGGVSGKLVVPGNAKLSLLLKRVHGGDGRCRMPLGFAPLSEAQTQVLSDWVNQGAHFDGATLTHWAYMAPIAPPTPQFSASSGSGWVKNPIDAFVLNRLHAEGLHPSPPASRATLLRRVCLDLTGLPPSLALQKSFEADTSPTAYETLVDKLLDSPEYGERMATPWLDLARYADSNGYEKDAGRTIWPYRDWVIRAFNTDMPYDRFIIEQLAGDVLPGATNDDLVATGFNRNTMLNQEGGVDQGEQRWLTLVDRVGTTGSVFLGSTLMCCQCHNHKYDPFSQAEFYKLLAFFDTSTEPTLKLYDPRLDTLGTEVAALKAELPKLTGAGLEATKKTVAELEAQVTAAESETTLILREKPNAYPPKAPIRLKGSYLNPGKVVVAGTPGVLPPMPVGARLDRLGLARWIASRENPLTARVEVNRVWSMVFGVGLVKTEGDFGTQGERPMYQDLLDWMAVNFENDGWSLKKLLRLIVTSNTYRQSSASSPALEERDPENRLLARGARFRMSAEMIRDNALAVGGIISLKQGGPSVFPDQPAGVWNSPYSDETWTTSTGDDCYRRGVYTYWKRTAPYPSFTAFDATSRESCTVNRVRTNTPLQALVLLNDPVYLMAARGLAKQMLTVSRQTDDARIRRGFEVLLAREPTGFELGSVRRLLEKEQARFATNVKEAHDLLGSQGVIAAQPPAESAAYLLTAQVLLNLDEAITKE